MIRRAIRTTADWDVAHTGTLWRSPGASGRSALAFLSSRDASRSPHDAAVRSSVVGARSLDTGDGRVATIHVTS